MIFKARATRALLIVSMGLMPLCANADVWRVVYDLDGTQLDIRNTPANLGNGTYDVGPGFVIIDYTDNGGSIADGPVQLRRYSLVQDFTAANIGANVKADLFAQSNFTGVQTLATGTLASGVITWSQSFPYKVEGTNTCTGQFCGLAGYQNGVPLDEAREDPVTFGAFRFAATGPASNGDFDADEVELPSNKPADTFLQLHGHEIRRSLVNPATADNCLLFPRFGAHTGDRDCDGSFALNELLRVVQLFNALQYHCAPGTEDGYDLGPGATGTCERHTGDFQNPGFALDLTELLRAVQLFNLGAFTPCPDKDGDDGYCVVL